MSSDRQPAPVRRRVQARLRHAQRGVMAVEFALMFLFGMLPVLLLTLTGVLTFAAKQSLTLAAAEGARAALRYGNPAERAATACSTARQSMQWLLTFTNDTDPCASGAITVSPLGVCPSTPAAQCMTVTTSFDYNAHPFLPGTQALYGWVLGHQITRSATVQLDTQGN